MTTSTWRWGIAGPGGIAERFAADLALVDGAVLAAVGSRSAGRAAEFADRFGAPTSYGSYEALAADPNVDVVYVASPHAFHARHATLFLEAGKHVLCEKPFALDAAQAIEVERVARANDRFVMEAMWSRFLPAYTLLVDVVRSGRIGDPLVVEADFGFRMPVLPEHRLFDLALGGGALLDLGVYPVQLCSLLLGSPDRVAATGTLGSTGVDELMGAVLGHASGALGVVKSGIRVGLSCRARISGSEGSIELPPAMHCPASVAVTDGRGREVVEAGHPGSGMQFQAVEVQRCLEAGRRQSEVMPMAETIAILSTLDEIRSQIGLRYPGA